MGAMGTLIDVNGKRYRAIRTWDNGYKHTFVEEETGRVVTTPIDCGTHFLVPPDWTVEMKREPPDTTTNAS